jgi:hypothetical protein
LIGELAAVRSCFLGTGSFALADRRSSARPAGFDVDGPRLVIWPPWAIAGFWFGTGTGWLKEASMFAD